MVKQENAIVSTDRRSGRDEVGISKLEYIQNYTHCINIKDTNITEKEAVMKNAGTKNRYMSAQQMIYTCPVKKFPKLLLKQDLHVPSARL